MIVCKGRMLKMMVKINNARLLKQELVNGTDNKAHSS